MPQLTAQSKSRTRIVRFMHLTVVLLSLLMISLITADTLHNKSFLADAVYLRVQFWCCLFFIVDVLVEMYFSPRRWHYLVRHVFFLLISVPYLNIIHHYNLPVGEHLLYVLRFVPMIRAAYVFTLVTGATTSSKWINNMLATYLIVLIVVVYFCSLTFFVSEHGVNALVGDYWSSLQWSVMSLTTAGCSIHAITPTGRVLGVVLSAVGLIFFPIFTVFLTHNYSDQLSDSDATSDGTGGESSKK